ncbi:GntR family transcriptional regulator [Embleya scabrispora]|uniref:GntR family transcriptional regulator n=1 Tax=Embleya scabrispora TaxID=159449 RepID=UPI0003A6D6B4|nr:GntR family transcriptional regulator [Embleya scabrispora]MYS80549.1 FCD domain-containing protein [Streptomyces sp. SID5474]
MKSDRNLAGGPPALSSVGRLRVRRRTSDRVYEELAAAIRDLRIEPGASLSETDLAEQLQVSRTPLREAIARLVDGGLVSVVPQVGTRVEPIRLHDVEQARFVRESLELAAFAAACEKAERDVAGLRSLLAEQERCHRAHDLDGFFAADEALHRQVFAMSGHLGAWQLMQPMKMHLNRFRRLGLPDPEAVRVLIDDHTAIVDALESGDAAIGHEHISRHARRVLEAAPGLQGRYPGYFA